MALWQHAIRLYPSEQGASAGNELSRSALREFISSWLDPSVSWHQDVDIFGDEDTNCLYITHSDDGAIEFEARLDVRRFDEYFACAIIRIANIFDLSIDSDGIALQSPSLDDIRRIVDNSEATRFVKNPDKYLTDDNC